MAWGLTKTYCQCNGSYSVPRSKVQECAPSNQALAACSPIITAVVKSTCGARRMFVSAIILIFLLAAIYWVSLPRQQTNLGARRPMRIQPQASRNTAPERIEAAETTESLE